jgi:hypothetical protein
LDETVSLVVPSRQNLVVLRKPIDKNALLGAFARCQENSMPSTETAPARENQPADKAPIESPSKVARPEAESERKPARIIELVDVVEEGPAHKRGKRSERKKR